MVRDVKAKEHHMSHYDEDMLAHFVDESNKLEFGFVPAKTSAEFTSHMRAVQDVLRQGTVDPRGLHVILSRGTEMESHAGVYRTEAAYVGSRTLLDHTKIPTMMEQWLEMFDRTMCRPHWDWVTYEIKLQMAWDLHHQFVCIHPFADGNGRVARLLLNRAMLGLITSGWHTVKYSEMSDYFAEIREYEDTVFPGTIV